MKMKRFFKFLTVAAILAAGFTGCSEEIPVDPNTGPGPDVKPEAGAPTYATFTFKVDGGAATKAIVTDEYGDGNTALFYNIRLLVFDYQADSTGICEADTLIGNTTLAQTQSATVLVRSGEKLLLVIANAGGKSALDAKLRNSHSEGGPIVVSTDPTNPNYSATSFKTFMNTLNTVDLGTGTPPAYVTDVSFSDLVLTGSSTTSTTNAMVFSNATDTAARRTLMPDIGKADSENNTNGVDKNHFIIYLQRTVGKVIAYYKNSTGFPVPTGDGLGEISAVYYNVQNVNRAVNLFQTREIAPPNKPIAPYFNLWNLPLVQPEDAEADSGAIFRPYYFRNHSPAYISHTLTYGSSLPASPSIYVTENATKETYNGAKTYLAIKATYTPVAGTAFISGVTNFDKAAGQFTLATEPSTNYIGQGFWRLHGKYFSRADGPLQVTPTGIATSIPEDVLFIGGAADSIPIKKVLYVIETGDTIGFGVADKTTFLLKDLGEYIQHYEAGVCYYRLNIRQGSVVGSNEYVLRNNWYQAAITGFEQLGSPSLEDLDDGSGTKETAPTYVTAEIRVLNWVPVDTETPVTPWEP
ncbi:MAG: Mfa1 family fimbria major subunit [Tannerellaceae bacterium]|jgi:hypothetical protein|nr:Mfa1 family fimbria major subunit [Tannerellaceae bacterium]